MNTDMHVRLVRLTKDYERQLGEMIEEWRRDQEENHTNHSPYAIFKNDYHDFDYYLEHLEFREEQDGRVVSTVYFLLDETRDRLLGAINIRHYLSFSLLSDGGHIGDGIRPSERRKGYATEMIRLALPVCRQLGMDRVLIVCDKDNPGSAKSIINNGGVLENEVMDEDGCLMQRYWIDIRDIPLNRTVEHSCGAVVCRGEGEARRVLLIRSHNGYWGFPKGHMEQGETRQETAIRETREETGCTVQLLDDFCTEEAYTLTREGRPDTIKQVTYFLACTDQQEVRPQTSEVAEIRWVDFGTAQELLPFESSRRILREAEQYLNDR